MANEEESALRPRASLDISPEVFVELCRALASGDDERSFRVKENGLPPDARFDNATMVDTLGYPTIRLWITSESFTNGAELPHPILETVRFKERSNGGVQRGERL